MERIDKEYGMDVNYLLLTKEEMETLKPFLEKLGVRMRWMKYDGKVFEVQAENPYKCWIGARERQMAERDMSERGLRAYEY